MNERMN